MYWVGPRAGVRYDLRQATNGQIQIRYLPRGAEAGSKTPQLTVGTYPLRTAFAVTDALSKRSGEVRILLPGGGVAAFAKARPTNVYLAYHGSEYQIEVFHPDPGRARQLVLAGVVAPIRAAGAQGPAPKPSFGAVSLHGLKTFARSLDRPVYWVGPRLRVTYELTQTPDGNIFLRYLPRGAAAGAPGTFLTVGTYPLRNAFQVTKALGQEKGVVSMTVGGNGIGVYRSSSATSVYVAYLGLGYQVEVYDPIPQRAQRLVASGRLRPVL